MSTRLLVHANSNSVDLGLQTWWSWLAEYQTEQEGKWTWWSKVAEVGTAGPDVCQMWMQRMGLDEGRRLAPAKPWRAQPRGKEDQNGEVGDFSDIGRGCWWWLRICWNLHHITTDFKVYGEWRKPKKKCEQRLLTKYFLGTSLNHIALLQHRNKTRYLQGWTRKLSTKCELHQRLDASLFGAGRGRLFQHIFRCISGIFKNRRDGSPLTKAKRESLTLQRQTKPTRLVGKTWCPFLSV